MPSELRLDFIDARLIERLHGGFPLGERPFAEVAAELGCGEDEVIERLRRLLAQGLLTRFGPLFQIEPAGGRFVLAAMAVPEARFDAVATIVNEQYEVAHNYRREHELNMWFVVAAESAAAAEGAIRHIEQLNGLPVLRFPKEREYAVELKLPIAGSAGHRAPTLASLAAPRGGAVGSGAAQRTTGLSELDRRLITATQAGLPLVARPYEAVGAALGLSSEAVRKRLAAMLDEGLIRRIGAVPNHYKLGFTANGMTVWDVADEQVDELGARVATLPGVSHCYRRPRRLPLWPYNLFAMLHGHSREEVRVQAARIAALLGGACRRHDILYSTAILKKTGLRLKED